MPGTINNTTTLRAIYRHHHTQLIVQCPRLHNPAKALGVPRMIFRMPRAVIAHNWQQQKIRAI